MATNAPMKVLLIESDSRDARLIQDILARSDMVPFSCTHAASLAEASELRNGGSFDAALLDLELPDSHGRDTLITVRSWLPDVPIVVLTGVADEVFGRYAVKQGAQDYLIKGELTKSLLVRSLTYALERKRSEAELKKYQGHLQELVGVRTGVLELANKQLQQEIGERRRAEDKLQVSLDRLRKVTNGIILAMACTIEIRDPYTAGHEQRVSRLAAAMAREMGLTDDVVDGIRVAGVLHDLGKISIPAEILNKPGKLSLMDTAIIRQHSHVGYEILKNVEFPWPIADIVLQHHERLNGCGYPQSIEAGDILQEARILAVADVVEAMSSHRPYRPALGIEAALEEIVTNRDILYDPEAVDACLALFTKKGYQLD